MSITSLAAEAKKASVTLSAVSTEVKNNALAAIAAALESRAGEITEANLRDLREAEASQLATPLLKRLKFDDKKIVEVVSGIHSLINLPDPVGTTLAATELDKGLELYKVTCPIGVIGVIFESRPDALVQISTLCLKSGNSVLLKGGSEAANTNRILASVISEASVAAGIPAGWIQLLETRAEVNEMLRLDRYIDLIIPRGSNEFVKYIMNNSSIAVLGHADGICHVYIDKDADTNMAVRVATDSKTQYVAVCNAAETFLIHAEAAGRILPGLKAELDKHKVEIRGCNQTQKIISCVPATEADWATEYLDYIVSIKVVSSLDEAIDHINTYGSGHTDVIITDNAQAASRFMSLANTGDAFWNCSSRFSDGFRYGLGAEVGVSTNKIHARGPVGLDGLMIYKWMLKGNGHIVADYASGSRKYTHLPLNKKYI